MRRLAPALDSEEEDDEDRLDTIREEEEEEKKQDEESNKDEDTDSEEDDTDNEDVKEKNEEPHRDEDVEEEISESDVYNSDTCVNEYTRNPEDDDEGVRSNPVSAVNPIEPSNEIKAKPGRKLIEDKGSDTVTYTLYMPP